MGRMLAVFALGWTLLGADPVVASDALAGPDRAESGVSAASEDAPQLLEGMVVSGIQPGPGLWQITASDGHVLWLLGTLSPLPRRMEWESAQVREVIEASGRVLLAPRAQVKADVGFFGGMALIPSALSARKNPDKQTLADVLPAALYERWTPLRSRYLGRGKGIEKRRPLLAANRLYEAALGRNGLSEKDIVDKAVRKLARRAKVEVHVPQVEVLLSDPKQALKDLRQTELDDIDCFEQTLARVENDLPLMRERANAWAVGDIELLLDLPSVDHQRPCADAVLQSTIARERGLDDLRARLQQAWLAAAEQSLAEHPTSFAVLPLTALLREGGMLDQLRERGYVVAAPGEEGAAVPVASSSSQSSTGAPEPTDR